MNPWLEKPLRRAGNRRGTIMCPYEQREVGNLSQRKGKKTIRPKGWERARIRVTDLHQSRDDRWEQ